MPNRVEMTVIRAKKLIVHIGSWKTGTTAIQSFLSTRYQDLAAEGILYPRTSRMRADGGLDTAHHALRQAFDAADGAMTQSLAMLLDGIDQERRQVQCHTVLLSSETFMNFCRPETLLRYIDADEVQIIATFRNQAEFISAMYYTEVCHRKVIDFPLGYLDGFDDKLLDYATCLVPWRRAYPNAQLSVSLFERGTPARDFPAAHIVSQIGLDWRLDPQDNKIEHRSLPAQATLFLRQLSASGWDAPAFFQIFEVCHRNPAWFAPIQENLSPAILRQILDDHAPQNHALAQHFISDGPREFARPQLTDQTTWDQALGDPAAVFPTILRRIVHEAAIRDAIPSKDAVQP